MFPSSKGDGHYIGVSKVWPKLKAGTSIADVTLHTLRHSFATVAVDLGFSEITIAGLLGHSLHSTTSRYAHNVDSTLLAAADRVSSEIRRRLFETQEWRNNVIAFPRA